MVWWYVTRILDTEPRSRLITFFQNWPASGWGLAIGDQSLATCPSLQETWQLWHPSQTARSMSMTLPIRLLPPPALLQQDRDQRPHDIHAQTPRDTGAASPPGRSSPLPPESQRPP